MSKHIEKYPGLYAGAKAAGIRYRTAYMRVAKLRWSIERALATPVGKRGRRPVMTNLAAREAKYLALSRARDPGLVIAPSSRLPWERPGYKVAEPAKRGRKVRTNYSRNVADDNSPPHIQRIRATFCNEFIKTGLFNANLLSKLKDYADECRAAKSDPERVPAEHEASRRGREEASAGYDSGRDAHQIDGAAARRIADFLRTE